MGCVFHGSTDEELNSRLNECYSELREMRFTYAVARSVQSPAKFGALKKDIAKILTIKSERAKGISTRKEGVKSGKAKK